MKIFIESVPVSRKIKKKKKLKCLIKERYKLIVNLDNSSIELYDLVTDPGERNNLANSQPDIARELYKEIELHNNHEKKEELRIKLLKIKSKVFK